MTSEEPNSYLLNRTDEEKRPLGLPEATPLEYFGRELDALRAEQAILGLIIAGQKTAYAAFQQLKASMFERPAHKAIFKAALALLNKAIEHEANLVYAELDGFYKTPEVDNYIRNLGYASGYSTTQAFVNASLSIIKGGYIKRQLLLLAQEMPEACEGLKADELLAKVSAFITDLAHVGKAKTNKDKLEVLANVVEQLTNPQNKELQGVVNVGYRRFEASINHFRRKQLIMLAAETGHGKTVSALNMAVNAAKAGHKVLFLSLEMGQEEMFTRAFMRELKGSKAKEDAQSVSKHFVTMPLEVLFTPNISVSDIRLELEAFERKQGGVDMVIVDYLGLVSTGDRSDYQREDLKVAHITSQLKAIAGEKNLLMLCLAQYTREGSKGELAKHKLLYAIKGGGSTSADADKVILLQSFEGKADAASKSFYVAKNRNGQAGVTQELVFRGEWQSLEEAQGAAYYG